MDATAVHRSLEIVAEFDDTWPSGIAPLRDGRLIVSFPRVEQPRSRTTLGLWSSGRLVPYPDQLTNDLAAGDATHRFTSIHGIQAAPGNRLLAIDTGAFDLQRCDPEAAGLYLIDVSMNAILRRYAFPRDVVDESTYLNDVVVDYDRGEAGTAFITDSGPTGPNGIIVVDLDTGRSMRRLANHRSVKGTDSANGFGIAAEGVALAMSPPPGADGIALSPDGKTLWWTPLASYDVWSIPTDVLADFTLPDERVASAVAPGPERDFASDGLDTDRAGNVYFTDLRNNAVRRYLIAENRFETLVTDERLVWPDAVAVGPDGYVYVTSSQLNRGPAMNGGTDARVRPYRLFRFACDAQPAQF